MTEKPDPRAAEIVRRKVEGQTYTKMAEDLGVSRKTIYNLRSGDAYIQVVDSIFSSLMDEIEELSQSEQHTIKMDALREKGRILRALLPSLTVVQHRADPDKARAATTNEIVNKRRRSEALIKALNLSKEQMKILEANVVSEAQKE